MCSSTKTIIVKTQEEKEKLITILNDYKVIYFYGNSPTEKMLIKKQFIKMYPDIDAFISFPSSVSDIYDIKNDCRHYIINNIYPGMRHTSPEHVDFCDGIVEIYPLVVFIMTNTYYDSVAKVYPDCLMVEFKNSELCV
jgi:hypothetical protein